MQATSKAPATGLLGSPRLLHFALPALILFALVAFSPAVLGDGDSWWHVRAGEWMLDHRAVPTTDPFSFTFAGKDWHAHEWLSEVLFALAYRAGGWSGVMLLAALAAASAAGLLFHWLRRHLGQGAAIIALFLVMPCIGPALLARPHLLALPLLVAWTGALIDARSRGAVPHLWWLALIALWANMHGSVLFAVALIGPFALEALIEQRGEWQRVVRQWVLFGIGALIAAMFTPRGPEGLLFLVQLTQLHSLNYIIEWQPPDFGQVNGIEIIVLAGLYVLLVKRPKVHRLRLLVLALLLAMTLQHQRHQMLLALVGTMIVAEALGRKGTTQTAATQAPRWAVPLIAAGFIAVIAVRLALPANVREGETSPATAFAHVPMELRSQPVLNGYPSGGFLIGQGVKPFIDGRTDLFGDAFFDRYNAIEEGRPGEVERAVQEFGITWSFLAPGSGAVKRLDAMPGWRRIYADTFIVVHRKDAPTP